MNAQDVERILAGYKSVTVAVIGDFCLDRYFEIDPGIQDYSAETGLPIHQVVAVRSSPGGGGNVLANVAALGVRRVLPVGFVGTDGEGYELLATLEALGVDTRYIEKKRQRPTPAYVKPRLFEAGKWRETNRYDIWPRKPLPAEDERALLARLEEAAAAANALIVSDYWETGKEGVVTPRVRLAIMALAGKRPELPVVVDSRKHMFAFRDVYLKPNEHELQSLFGPAAAPPRDERPSQRALDTASQGLAEAGRTLAARIGRAVFMTLGERGMLVCRAERGLHIPAYPLEGAVDPVGAGDTVIAALASTLATGASAEAAGALGVIAASITVEQVGTTGVARPAQIAERFQRYIQRFPEAAEWRV